MLKVNLNVEALKPLLTYCLGLKFKDAPDYEYVIGTLEGYAKSFSD